MYISHVNIVDWPIAVTTMDDVTTAGVVLWRQKQQLFATIAVKSTFTLVSGARMTVRAPLPIERTERAASQAGGIEPGDLAPCLLQPEIWVRGHAWYPPAEGAPSVRVRLVMARDSNAIVRKSVEIPVEPGPPPFVHALAPLSRTWPVRSRLLGNFPAELIDRSPLELPDVFDWEYFQAALPDQRFAALRGDEWIRLEGIHPTMYRFDTRLPSAWCVAELFGPIGPLCFGAPVQMGLDSIQIDADHGYCALVFRGHIPVPPHVPLDDLQFVAALGLPDKTVPKLEPRTRKSTLPAPPLPPGHSPSLGDTMVLDPAMWQALAPEPPLPMDDGPSRFPSSIPPSAVPNSAFGHGLARTTLPLAETTLETGAHRDVMPFHHEGSLDRTVSFPNEFAAHEPSAVTKPPSSALRSHSYGQTTPLDAVAFPTAAHEDVLPFHAASSVSVTTSTTIAEEKQSASLEQASNALAPQVKPMHDVDSPVFVAPPSDDATPRTLGECFLTAMEEAPEVADTGAK